MTEPIRRIDEVGAATVLRGMTMRTQPLRLAGKPRAQTPTTAHEPQIVHPVMATSPPYSAPDETALMEVRERAREQGYREGWEQGRQAGYEAGAHEGAVAAKQEVLAQASDVIAEAAEAASEQAFQQTSQALEKKALERWSQHQARLDALLAALPAQIALRLEAAQDDMLALCMEALLHILGEQAVQAPVIRSTVRHALDQLRARPLIRIELHPDDLAALRRLPGWDAWCEQQAPGAQWVGNEALVAGGCVVVSPEGSLDARLDGQLQAFRALLLDSRRASHTPDPGASA